MEESPLRKIGEYVNENGVTTSCYEVVGTPTPEEIAEYVRVLDATKNAVPMTADDWLASLGIRKL